MRYFFPIHLDGGNRGCEAIAKGSALLIGAPADQLFGYCRDVALDRRLGLDRYLQLVPCQRESFVVDKSLGLINRLFHTTKTLEARLLYPYRTFLRLMTPQDIMISTGGDMLCYDDNEVIFTNNLLHAQGMKTILWGCSMGPENMTPAKRQTLFNFSLIYTRESLTYNYFRQLGLPNVCLLPDPAFILPDEPCTLPPCFSGDKKVIGLNVSNYVMGGMRLDGRFGQEVLSLIRQILLKTDYQILLIPHVTWNDGRINQDDREMARLIRDHFAPGRISILDIDALNYCQIRHVISRCYLFIGARTHAVISAYAMCVPTIALGYSIKSRGIALDLGLDAQLVCNCRDFTPGDLLHSFHYLDTHANDIRAHLQALMPDYKQRTYQIREHLAGLLKRD